MLKAGEGDELSKGKRGYAGGHRGDRANRAEVLMRIPDRKGNEMMR